MSSPYSIFNPGPDWTEDVRYYRPGFLHPVEINDTFKNGRYVVLNKLGHGGFSTVWLAHDTQSRDQKYVALKILGGHGSKDVNEIAIQRWLSKSCKSFDTTTIANMRDYFPLQGPNGRHIVLVFELCGPSLSNIREESVKMRPDFSRMLAKQVAHVVENFHNNDIAIGDLSTDNILLRFTNIQKWSVTEIYNSFGAPAPWQMIPRDRDQPFPACGPRNLYSDISLSKSVLSLIQPQIVLADLNEVTDTCACANSASHLDDDSIGINGRFAGPELIMSLERRHTKALDIWALACIFFEMRTGSALMSVGGWCSHPEFRAMQSLLGEVPSKMRAEIEDAVAEEQQREDEVDPDDVAIFLPPHELGETPLLARLIRLGNLPFFHQLTMQQRIQLITDTTSEDDRKFNSSMFNLESHPYAEPPLARISDGELADFEDLLSKMLKYLPEDRLTIAEVLEHPWLNKEYKYLDDMTLPWLSKYMGGWQYVDAKDWYDEVIVNGGVWQKQNNEDDWPSDDSEDESDVESSSTSVQNDDIERGHASEQDHSVEIPGPNTTDCQETEHVSEFQSEHHSMDGRYDEKVLTDNTTKHHNLRHVFTWQEQEVDPVDQDHELTESRVHDSSTAECRNLEHIFP